MDSSLYIALAGLIISVLSSVAIVSWGYGKLAGWVTAIDRRLSHIESEHTGLLTGLAGMQAEMRAIGERLDKVDRQLERIGELLSQRSS